MNPENLPNSELLGKQKVIVQHQFDERQTNGRAYQKFCDTLATYFARQGLPVVDEDSQIDASSEAFHLAGQVENQIDWLRQHAPDIPTPKTTSWAEFWRAPFFPVVAKDYQSQRGENIFLLENLTHAQSFATILQNRPDLLSRLEMQAYIDNGLPFHYSTRVTVDATGQIYFAGLLSSPKENKLQPTTNDFQLLGENNFQTRSIVSNVAQGGNSLLLQGQAVDDKQQQLLDAVGWGRATLPATLTNLAPRIAITLGRQIGLVVGLDFVFDREQKPYFLEANFDPSLKSYANFLHQDVLETQRRVYNQAIRNLLRL